MGQPRTVKQLRDLEIDEVSLVDRPANQHGLVAITKRDEGTMPELDDSGPELYDERGRPVDESQLQPGDVAYTADGERMVMLTDEDVQALLEQAENGEGEQLELPYDAEDAHDEDRQLVGVGKAGVTINSPTLREFAREYGTGTTTRRKAAGVAAVTGGATGTVSYVGGNRRGRKSVKAARYTPSLGREVAAELSKALGDDDRDQVISKVAAHVDRLSAVAETAVSKAAELEAFIEQQGWTEVAKGYELPVRDDELGSILANVSEVLDDRQMDTLDRIFKAAGAPVEYVEAGVAGYTDESEVMDQVNATVRELVGKADITPEQAVVALFEANPGAYDAYLAER